MSKSEVRRRFFWAAAVFSSAAIVLFGAIKVHSVYRLGAVRTNQLAVPYQESPQEARYSELAAVVLGETEVTWARLFGGRYEPLIMVLYKDRTASACGIRRASLGPFYCSKDRRLYLDLSFFGDLETNVGAIGDGASAYVVAHEVGHHVQNLIGTAAKVRETQQRASKQQAVDLVLRTELQADCYAGVWAHDVASRIKMSNEEFLDGMLAFTAIAHRMQQRARGLQVNDTFTHGTPELRRHWLQVGIQNGNPNECDTFSAARL